MLRQSQPDNSTAHRQDIQSEQGLLQTGAYNENIPGGIVEGFHRECAKENKVRCGARPGQLKI